MSKSKWCDTCNNDNCDLVGDMQVSDTNKPSCYSNGTRPTKDEYYLGIADAVLRRSTCLRRKYGAVLVKGDEIVSTGYNGSPRGEENCC